MDLQGQLSLHSIHFFSHDVPPNTIEIIEYLGNTRFRHLSVVRYFDFVDFLYGFGWDPLIRIMILLKLLAGGRLIGLNSELVAYLRDALVAEDFGAPHDVCVRYILIICGLFEELDELLIISL